MAFPGRHTTVLLDEAVSAVLSTPDGIYVDGTFGRGGQARALLGRLSPRGRLVAFDKDPDAVAAAGSGETRVDDPRFSIRHASFAVLARIDDGMGALLGRQVAIEHGVNVLWMPVQLN